MFFVQKSSPFKNPYISNNKRTQSEGSTSTKTHQPQGGRIQGQTLSVALQRFSWSLADGRGAGLSGAFGLFGWFLFRAKRRNGRDVFWWNPVDGGWSSKIGVPQTAWIIMENPIKMDDLGVPLF